MIRIRSYPEANYKAIFFNGKTIRQKHDTNKPFLIPPTTEIEDVAINSKCYANCFIGSTKVLTINGYKEIQYINTDDIVLSYNIDIDKFENKKVYNLFKNEYKGDIIEIILDNNKIIQCTPNHKFLTINRGYVMASELTEEDDIKEM